MFVFNLALQHLKGILTVRSVALIRSTSLFRGPEKTHQKDIGTISPRQTREQLSSSSCFGFEISQVSEHKIEAQRFTNSQYVCAPMKHECKGTNKRAKSQINLDFFEREHFRPQVRGSANRAKYSFQN